METIEVLDVTVIEPRLKHPTIFNRFDALKPGEAFAIHNDHDPKPLYYQLLGERGKIFEWEYLESGPEWWKVKILKNTTVDTTTVGEIVAKDYRKIEVFKKFGIDYCCGGSKTIQEVCQENGVSQIEIEFALEAIEKNKESFTQEQFDNWELDVLTEYIINTHHSYIREHIEIVYGLAQKVAGHHGSAAPETVEIAIIFSNVAEELIHHILKEEEIVFPYIKNLVALKKKNEKLVKLAYGPIKEPIHLLTKEHDKAGEAFKKIREITNNYELPKDACNSFMYLYKKLSEFEADLHQHVHLENNILFPKAISLENTLFNKE